MMKTWVIKLHNSQYLTASHTYQPQQPSKEELQLSIPRKLDYTILWLWHRSVQRIEIITCIFSVLCFDTLVYLITSLDHSVFFVKFYIICFVYDIFVPVYIQKYVSIVNNIIMTKHIFLECLHIYFWFFITNLNYNYNHHILARNNCGG